MGDGQLMRDRVTELVESYKGVPFESRQARVESLIELGKAAIPHILERLAIDYHDRWVTILVLEYVRGQRNKIELVESAGTLYDERRREALKWGRGRRYLVNWLCPECGMNYDAHISYGCHWKDGRMI